MRSKIERFNCSYERCFATIKLCGLATSICVVVLMTIVYYKGSYWWPLLRICKFSEANKLKNILLIRNHPNEQCQLLEEFISKVLGDIVFWLAIWKLLDLLHNQIHKSTVLNLCNNRWFCAFRILRIGWIRSIACIYASWWLSWGYWTRNGRLTLPCSLFLQ